MDIPFFVEKLKQMVFETQSESHHLLVIDGLDEILTKRDRQYESLASLLYEVDRLNLEFARNKNPIKIVILCRTDIFESLPNANKNKLRQDSAIHLDWFHDPTSPHESGLVKLVNYRASLANKKSVDIFAEYFPATIEGPHGSKQDVRRFLLYFTRHTPRDFVTLLNFVQKFNDTPEGITTAQLSSATRAYSVEYFVPEIKDELHGHLSPDEIDQVIQLFSCLAKREFTYGDVTRCASSFDPALKIDIQDALKHLFECSALGTLDRVHDQTFFTTKYRNRNSVLNLNKTLILHRGMWKALNLT